MSGSLKWFGNKFQNAASETEKLRGSSVTVDIWTNNSFTQKTQTVLKFENKKIQFEINSWPYMKPVQVRLDCTYSSEAQVELPHASWIADGLRLPHMLASRLLQ